MIFDKSWSLDTHWIVFAIDPLISEFYSIYLLCTKVERMIDA